VVDVGNRKDRRVAGIDVSAALDHGAEIERDLPIVIVPHQALDQENRSEAHAARDWLRVVQPRCGVNDHIPRRQLDLLAAADRLRE
jgi:hypothetical protein